MERYCYSDFRDSTAKAPWELIVAYLVKKLCAFYATRRFLLYSHVKEIRSPISRVQTLIVS
jgi:hypothetical protein